MKKLIAIDLDGTTLNPQSILTPYTQNVLQKAMHAGHYVSIATGRPYRLSQQFYQQLELETPMVNFNGALVHLPNQNWAQEWSAHVQRDIVFDILGQKEQLQLDFVAVENKETFFIDSFEHFDANFFASEPAPKNLLTTQNMQTNPNSVMIRTKLEQSESVAEHLQTTYGDWIDVRTWGGAMPILEIVAKGIHKAKGVQKVADYLKIPQKDILAFGDEHNDEELLAHAGWGVAMQNATDKLKGIANDVTEQTNAENGLANYLAAYLHLNE